MYACLAACYNNAIEVVVAYRRELEEAAERERQERAAALELQRLHRIREEEERQRRYEHQRKERQEWEERQRQEEKKRQEREEQLQKERAAAFESQRLKHLLEEQARQELKDRQLAARIQAAEIERIRKEEEQKMQVLENAMDELTEDIDFYIRTRRRFDSRIPQAFFCDLSSVAQDPAVFASLADVNRFSVEVGYDEISLREFIEDNESFVLQGNKIGVRNLTPFQGAVTHRVYGYFRCFSCKRDWQSAATYTNNWQKCKACEGECYPYEQHVLERSQEEQSDNLRPHDTRRCQRCLELGRLCLPNRYFAVK